MISDDDRGCIMVLLLPVLMVNDGGRSINSSGNDNKQQEQHHCIETKNDTIRSKIGRRSHKYIKNRK